ncbi:hydroxyethylthiazole kinase [Actinomyces slackii]|uniref:Hydroxyethylthiazole kinase n=1 Tax=Actinomyces slackii TaxID=52774 RepID=A0A3S4SQR4_9ACTO|nr:hydroxyethylthiazole kinase [Actinomyces slackii]VEG75551.1 Hydroxyethylthiazole kinase [Actinomyces slackii]
MTGIDHEAVDIRALARRTAAALRSRAPLVHCLTATASMHLVANGLLAVGSRPMMTETVEEAPMMTGQADALLVNLGALSADGARGIPATVTASRASGHPWVLDPVAVGIAPVRTALAHRLLDQGPAVVRANASEIRALNGSRGGCGTDTTARPEEAEAEAMALAQRTGGIVAVSGEADLITDGRRTIRLHCGSPLLTRVTGTGCLLGALMASGLGAGLSPWESAVGATALLGLAGQDAASRSTAMGSFQVALLDCLDEAG